jgi:hypothetical protein
MWPVKDLFSATLAALIACMLFDIQLLPSKHDLWSPRDYTRLADPKSSIRLLRMRHATGTARIELTLEEASFSSWPSYTALSYTWDTGPHKRSIFINGKSHDVSNHLWGALRSIRDRMLFGDILVWVDAICINQDDEDEKASQIAVMPSIYERAQAVYLWLGDHFEPRWTGLAYSWKWDTTRTLREAEEEWPGTATWMFSLMNAEYWKRCWVIQELRMASDIYVLYHVPSWYTSKSEAVPWEIWIHLVRLFEAQNEAWVPTHITRRVLRIEEIRHPVDTKQNTFTSLLEGFNDCFCSNWADKVYALIGIAEDHMTDVVAANYSQSRLSMYSELIRLRAPSELPEARTLTQHKHAADMVYFASLLRASISRKAFSMAKFHEWRLPRQKPGRWEYKCSAGRSPPCPWEDELVVNIIGYIQSLLISLRDAIRAPSIDLEWFWHCSMPENSQDWSPVESTTRFVSVSGRMNGVVYRVGPTYLSFSTDPGTVKSWLRELDSDSLSDKGDVDHFARSLRYLTAVLKGRVGFKVRNFVRLDDTRRFGYLHSRLFLAKDPDGVAFVGIGPETTRSGDGLVQFLKTDAVLLVRASSRPELTEIVGRAGVVQGEGMMNSPSWNILSDKELIKNVEAQAFETMLTLQQLTRLSFDSTVLDTERVACHLPVPESIRSLGS